MRLLLVDSSAWIESFSKRPDRSTVDRLVAGKKAKRLATCGMIFAEVVRGARGRKEFRELREEFQALLWLPIEFTHWELAASLGSELSQRGLHPPTTDLLIASVAIEGKCQLLHRDRHFDQIAQYFPLHCA